MERNSHRFQTVGTLHTRLRTLNLLKRTAEYNKLRPVAKYLRCGIRHRLPAGPHLSVTEWAVLQGFRAFCLTPFLNRSSRSSAASLHGQRNSALPGGRLLAGNDELWVVFSSACTIPATLHQVESSRELTCREVSERHGTHIVLWHKQESRVAGAYRPAVISDLLPAHASRSARAANISPSPARCSLTSLMEGL